MRKGATTYQALVTRGDEARRPVGRPKAQNVGPLLWFTLLLGGFHCQPQSASPRANSGPGQHEWLLTDVEAERFEKDQRKSRVTTSSLRLDRRRQRMRTDKLKLWIYQEGKSEAVAELTSGKSRCDLKNSRFYLLEGVRLLQNHGPEIVSSTANYDAKRDWLDIPQEIVLEGENYRGRAKSGKGQLKKQEIELEGPVEAIIDGS